MSGNWLGSASMAWAVVAHLALAGRQSVCRPRPCGPL